MAREAFLPAEKHGMDAARHISVVAAAFLIAMSTVFSRPSPFAASFTAAMSGLDCIGAFVGSVFGYLITGRFEEFAAVSSALMSVMAVRLITYRKKSRAADWISAVTAACSVFAADFLTADGVHEIMICFACGLLAGAGALVFLNIKRLISQKDTALTAIKNSPPILISVLAFAGITASILSFYTVNVFNIGIIVCGAAVLTVTAGYGIAAGCLCAAAAGLGTATVLPQYGFVFAVTACAAAVAKSLGDGKKTTAAGAFVLTATLGIMLFGMNSENLALTADLFISAAVFLLLPRSLTDAEQKLLEHEYNENSVRALFSRRLKFARAAVGEVRRTVDLTADRLEKRERRDISWVYNSACDEICSKCRFNMQCWGQEYGDNTKLMSLLVKKLKNGEEISAELFPEKLSERCPSADKLCEKLKELYNSFISCEAEKRRIARMRAVLTVQLSATENLLERLSDEMDETGEDTRLNKAAGEVLKNLGCDDLSAVSVSVGEHGRMSVEAYSSKGFFCSKQELCDAMSLALRRRFDLPVFAGADGSYKLSMFTKTTFFLDVEICQISREDGAVCGDYYESFIDSSGTAYIVLSDGMGTGSRARVDSSFACGMLIRLLQAGVGIEAGLGIINMSLMVKSSDESFATLELCKIDLYDGNVELYKAGSANTYIRCGSVNTKSGCKGLPMGVRDTPVYDKQTFKLGNRDMIVMTSDGAKLNEKWLYREMAKPDIDLKDFSKQVAQTARFYSGGSKADDISVIAMRLYK